MQKALKWHLYRNPALVIYSINGDLHFRFDAIDYSCMNSGLILGLRPANERRRYKVTPSLIGWAQT